LCHSACCQKATEVGQRFSSEKAFIIQEKRFIIWQKNIEVANLNILCLQAFNLAPKNGLPVFYNSQFDRCLHSPGRKTVVSFTTKYAVPRQIKPRILGLSIRTKQSNLSAVFIFVSCEEKDYYRFV